MKTVFTNAMCAHVWAQQTQAHGRSASMHFTGEYLYSYNTQIGYIPNGAEFGLCALLTSNTYSMTTSGKHMPAARDAVRGRVTWYVPHLSVGAGASASNADYLLGVYRAQVRSMQRMLSWYWTSVQDVYGGISYSWNEYASFCDKFEVERAVDTRSVDAELIWQRCERLTRERADPAYVARAEARKAARAEAQRKRDEEARARRAELERLNKLGAVQRVAEWLEGNAAVYLHYRDVDTAAEADDVTMGDLLRLKPGHPDIVQTSRGAEVPTKHALLAFGFYQRVRNGAEPRTFERSADSAPVRLGSFSLDSIDTNGNVRAGCHTFTAAAISDFAKRAGWVSWKS